MVPANCPWNASAMNWWQNCVTIPIYQQLQEEKTKTAEDQVPVSEPDLASEPATLDQPSVAVPAKEQTKVAPEGSVQAAPLADSSEQKSCEVSSDGSYEVIKHKGENRYSFFQTK